MSTAEERKKDRFKKTINKLLEIKLPTNILDWKFCVGKNKKTA